MKILDQRSVTIATLVTLLLSASYVQASASLPRIHRDGLIDYLSGGVGQDEAKAVATDSKNWPLTLEFVVMHKPRAEFAADVKVVISDLKNHALIRANAVGQFLLANVSPGSYVVDATFGDTKLHRSVIVKSGQPTKALFEWPAGTGETY